MFGLVVSTIGYALLLGQKHLSVGVKYFALFLIVPGGYITQPITLAWLSNCVSGHYKRSVASAFQVGVGNIGKSLLMEHVLITTDDSSSCRWHRGF